MAFSMLSEAARAVHFDVRSLLLSGQGEDLGVLGPAQTTQALNSEIQNSECSTFIFGVVVEDSSAARCSETWGWIESLIIQL